MKDLTTTTPPRHQLLYSLTLITALLLTALSLGGLLASNTFYPTEALRRSLLSNDAVNLFIGLPILVGSLVLARRGKLIGWLFWPGALFYIAYNALAYTITLYHSFLFIPNLALLVLSLATITLLLARMDAPAVQRQLTGAIRERFTGGVLVVFGLLFFLLAASKLAGAFTGRAPLAWPDIAMQCTDLLITPAWVAGGVLLWQRKALGYAVGVGLLFQASMLFVGLLAFFIINAIVTAAPFPMADFLVVFSMGLFCFIPFGLLIRGVLSASPPLLT